MLANVDTNQTYSLSSRTDDQNCYLRGVGQASQNALKDEAVLEKLAEMSKNLTRETCQDDNDMFNINSKTGSVMATTRCNTYTNKGLNPSYSKR